MKRNILNHHLDLIFPSFTNLGRKSLQPPKKHNGFLMRLAPMSRAVGTNGKRTESKSLIIFHYSQNLWLFWMDSSKMFINSLNIPKGSKWENVQQSFTQMVDRSRDSTHHKTKSMPPKKDAISKRKQSSKQWPQQKYRRNKGSLYHWCPSIWPYESLVIILFGGIGWWYLRGWLVMQLVHNYHHKGFNLDVTMMFMTITTIMKLFSWGPGGWLVDVCSFHDYLFLHSGLKADRRRFRSNDEKMSFLFGGSIRPMVQWIME